MPGDGFGRKGLGEGAAEPQRSAFPAQRIAAPDPEMAAKRAAFIAAERARAAEAAPTASEPVANNLGYSQQAERILQQNSQRPATKPKSMWMAYFYWYFCGPISAHRFYLGATSSAIKQCGGFVGGLIVLFIGSSAHISIISGFGVVCVIAAFLWVIADMFFIPGLCRKANEALHSPARYFD